MALQTSREQRFRAGSLFFAALVASWSALLCVSAFEARETEENRLEDRTGILSPSPSPGDVLVLTTVDQWNDQSITVVAIEPVGHRPALPPGLTRLPDVGRATVSPALSAAIADEPALAARYQTQATLSPAGVVNGDEMLAYIRVPTGTLSGDGEAIMRAKDGQYTGEGPVLRLQSFGTRGSAGTGGLPVTVGLGEVIENTYLATYTGLIAAPALVLLGITLGVSSAARDRRMALLYFLGVPKRRRVGLVVMESLAPAVPGVLLAAATWTVLGGQDWLLAGAGHGLFAGDGGLSPVQLGATTALVLLLTVTLAAAVGFAFTTPKGGRPESGRRRLSVLAVIPAAAAGGLLLVALSVHGPARADLAFAGSTLAILAAPLVVPTVLRGAGAWLAGLRRPTIWLSGRVMAHDPARSGRPFGGLAALAVLVAASSGYLAAAQYTEAPQGAGAGTQVVGLEWRGGDDTVVSRLQERLPDALVARYTTGADHHASHGHADGHADGHEENNPSVATPGESSPGEGSQQAPGTQPVDGMAPSTAPAAVEFTVAASCNELVTVTEGLSCAPNGEVVGPGLPDLLRKLALLTHGEEISAVRFGPATEGHGDDHGAVESAVVLASGDALQLDTDVREAAGGMLPVWKVSGLASSVMRPSPLVPWIHSGLVGAAILLAAACLITLRDRFSGIIGQHQALSLLGLGQGNFRLLGASLFAVPYAVATVCGLTLGLLSCVVFSDAIGVPWTDLARVAGSLVLAGAITTALLPRTISPVRAE